MAVLHVTGVSVVSLGCFLLAMLSTEPIAKLPW